MKYPKDKKSAYLTGYDKISMLDDLIILGGGNKWVADWEETATKPLNDYASDKIKKGTMYTETDNLFKYSFMKYGRESTLVDDPTYLGYNLKFDTLNSPLFNYGNSTIESTENFLNSSVLSFIEKYSSIPEINYRKKIYYSFIEIFNTIFHRTLQEEGSKQWVKSYCIEDISGLDKLNEKMVKYDKEGDKLTITLTEDVTLKSTYLAELYQNLSYSYKTKRHIVPENTLRFDLLIEVTDIRIFKYFNEENLESRINFDPPRIIYKLHDCNFDFTKSMPFESSMAMGGYGGNKNSNPSSLKFDIRYKSITKEFKSSMDSKIWLINNTSGDLGANRNFNLSNLFHNGSYDNDIMAGEVERQTKLSETTDSENITVGETYGTALGDTVEGKKQNILDKLKDTFIDEAKNYANKLIEKYNDIRGGLILGVIRSIREPLELPPIYPDNVYSSDFLSLSLETFAKGLASKELNNLEDAAKDALFGLTNIPKI